MFFCNACGRELTEHDSICPECGAVIRKDMTIDEKYKYRLPVTLLATVLSATVYLLVLYEISSLCLFLLIPIIFIRNFSKPLTYVIDGVCIGFIIGDILLHVCRLYIF